MREEEEARTRHEVVLHHNHKEEERRKAEKEQNLLAFKKIDEEVNMPHYIAERKHQELWDAESVKVLPLLFQNFTMNLV